MSRTYRFEHFTIKSPHPPAPGETAPIGAAETPPTEPLHYGRRFAGTEAILQDRRLHPPPRAAEVLEPPPTAAAGAAPWLQVPIGAIPGGGIAAEPRLRDVASDGVRTLRLLRASVRDAVRASVGLLRLPMRAARIAVHSLATLRRERLGFSD